jgi:uncharacterized membrane protein
MNKSRNIFYWVVTAFLALGMTAGGVQQLLQIGRYNEIVASLGYPRYMLSIIGTWKLLGVIAILVPGFPMVKEWAYAGFFFVMSGAFLSHLIMGQGMLEAMPSLTLMIATVLSWYLRPANRRVAASMK